VARLEPLGEHEFDEIGHADSCSPTQLSYQPHQLDRTDCSVQYPNLPSKIDEAGQWMKSRATN